MILRLLFISTIIATLHLPAMQHQLEDPLEIPGLDVRADQTCDIPHARSIIKAFSTEDAGKYLCSAVMANNKTLTTLFLEEHPEAIHYEDGVGSNPIHFLELYTDSDAVKTLSIAQLLLNGGAHPFKKAYINSDDTHSDSSDSESDDTRNSNESDSSSGSCVHLTPLELLEKKIQWHQNEPVKNASQLAACLKLKNLFENPADYLCKTHLCSNVRATKRPHTIVSTLVHREIGANKKRSIARLQEPLSKKTGSV